MRARMKLSGAVLALTALLTISACGDRAADNASNVPTVPPAVPQSSPIGTAKPAGEVRDQAAAQSVVTNGGAVAILAGDGNQITLYPRQDGPAQQISLPGAQLTAIAPYGDGFAAVGPEGIVKLGKDGGAASTVKKTVDKPLSIAEYNGDFLVGTETGKLLRLSKDGEVTTEITGFVRADRILVAPNTATEVKSQVTVIDQAQSAVIPVDVESGALKASLRAGNGATNAVVDQYGRILVAGTRDSELYAYFGLPIVQRLRRPVAESPFAITYDNQRNLVWVASTGTNEAVAYDIARGDAREQTRIPTVGQVSAMTINSETGDLLLVSGRGEGLQIVPAAAR